MRPAVVLFDLDDTLFRHREAVDDAATATVRLLDDAASDEVIAAELVRWRDLEEHHYHRYLGGEIGFEDQRRARARDFAAAYGIDLVDDVSASTWWADYMERYRSAWRLHDDALPCLDDLGRRFPAVRFGLITNGELAFQTAKVDAVALANRMDHVVASGEFGAVKPDPAIFLHACSLFAADPDDCVYVGDRLRTDALGAAAAGLTGVWLDRRGERDHAAPDELARVRVIGSLTQLGETLETRER
ncbi:HAD family hydrolase [Herbiconiux sp. L3-i23]|uniref:HAD family hydrolase n=1 Tax=Herbiconiux sp. L3-i23 TaxID=2905871 RepID=UPI002049ECC6|nr:HAD family hydrolase [Herbiconiux sp. L3-i23]BDI21560.1 hydrolase [Herbiconiux sp. L3-i23]